MFVRKFFLASVGRRWKNVVCNYGLVKISPDRNVANLCISLDSLKLAVTNLNN